MVLWFFGYMRVHENILVLDGRHGFLVNHVGIMLGNMERDRDMQKKTLLLKKLSLLWRFITFLCWGKCTEF